MTTLLTNRAGSFLNSIAALWLSLSAPTNASGQAFRSQSQTNVHSMVPYDDDDNNDDKFDGLLEYNYVFSTLILFLVPTNI